MRTLAVFVHYSKDGKPCPNALAYAYELRHYFDDVVIASNIEIPSEYDNVIPIVFEKNAYDFGYFYQALETLDAYDGYDKIGFFNDSNYIIKSLGPFLRWQNDFDFYGITDSHEKRPDVSDVDQYHIQSHVLIFKGKAISALRDFFKKIKFERYFDYTGDLYDLRAQIIICCELRLTKYMMQNGVSIGSYFSADSFISKVSYFPKNINMHVLLWKELIEYDYPFIKKKIVHRGFSESDNRALDKTRGMTPMSCAPAIIKQYGNNELIKFIRT